MSKLPSRFTIERVSTPAFRDEAGRLAPRYLGHQSDGRLAWMPSLLAANTYETRAEAVSFRRHRLGDAAGAEIVRHTVQ